jgi:hypothetical protein
MGFLSSVFGGGSIPDPVTVDAAKEAEKARDYNLGTLKDFYEYSPELTEFMQGLFNDTNPNAQKALDTNYGVGTELASKGYTSAMGDFMKFLQSESLAAGAASGMPVGSAFAANLGAGIGAQQLLSNQLQGTNLLGQTSNQQTALNQYLMSPALTMYSANLSNPGQFMSVAQGNANTQNQFNLAQSENDSWFGKLLMGIGGTALGNFAGGAGFGISNSMFKDSKDK